VGSGLISWRKRKLKGHTHPGQVASETVCWPRQGLVRWAKLVGASLYLVNCPLQRGRPLVLVLPGVRRSTGTIGNRSRSAQQSCPMFLSSASFSEHERHRRIRRRGSLRGAWLQGPGSGSVCRDQVRLTTAKLSSSAREITGAQPQQAKTAIRVPAGELVLGSELSSCSGPNSARARAPISGGDLPGRTAVRARTCKGGRGPTLSPVASAHFVNPSMRLRLHAAQLWPSARSNPLDRFDGKTGASLIRPGN
jgi:hypothetical protein